MNPNRRDTYDFILYRKLKRLFEEIYFGRKAIDAIERDQDLFIQELERLDDYHPRTEPNISNRRIILENANHFYEGKEMIIDAFKNRLIPVADGIYYRGYPESEDYYSSDSDDDDEEEEEDYDNGNNGGNNGGNNNGNNGGNNLNQALGTKIKTFKKDTDFKLSKQKTEDLIKDIKDITSDISSSHDHIDKHFEKTKKVREDYIKRFNKILENYGKKRKRIKNINT